MQDFNQKAFKRKIDVFESITFLMVADPGT